MHNLIQHISSLDKVDKNIFIRWRGPLKYLSYKFYQMVKQIFYGVTQSSSFILLHPKWCGVVTPCNLIFFQFSIHLLKKVDWNLQLIFNQWTYSLYYCMGKSNCDVTILTGESTENLMHFRFSVEFQSLLWSHNAILAESKSKLIRKL